jgi:uncharacterized protein YhjY with autotransporter beta-barrel domain
VRAEGSGSFDFASASLRDAEAALRMTGWMDLRVLLKLRPFVAIVYNREFADNDDGCLRS